MNISLIDITVTAILVVMLFIIMYITYTIKKIKDSIGENKIDLELTAQYISELQRVNKLLKVINNINKLIVREKDEKKLINAIIKEITTFWDYSRSIFVDPDLNPTSFSEASNVEKCTCVKRALESKNIQICRVDECPVGTPKDSVVIALPVVYGSKIYGAIVISSTRFPDREEIELLQTLSSDIAFALEHLEIEKIKNEIYAQITDNISRLAKVIDKIRNPIAIISGIAETKIDKQEVISEILEQIRRIDELCNEVEECWIKSERLVERLKKT